MKRFMIDARKVQSFDDFVDATNVAFIEHLGGKWNGNGNALNDYLSWPEEGEYELELLGSEICTRSLGHALFEVLHEIIADNKQVQPLLR